MHIAELILPGHRILSFPEAKRDDALALIRLAVDHVAEAAVGVNLFEETYQSIDQVVDEFKETFRARASEPRSLADAVPLSKETPAERDTRTLQDEIARKRARWRERSPLPYRRALTHMAAREFVFALDGIEKALGQLVRMPDAPPPIVAALDDLERSIPFLLKVRNSLHHLEQRVQGQRERGKSIDLKAVNNGFLNAPAGSVLIAGSVLNGNRIGITLEDGEYGEVEVSAANLEVARLAVQATIDGCEWVGFPSHEPSI